MKEKDQQPHQARQPEEVVQNVFIVLPRASGATVVFPGAPGGAGRDKVGVCLLLIQSGH